MFEHTRCSRSAFGSAVKASQLLLKQTGGKLVAFQTTLPTSGQGSLENRLPQRMLEPDQEKGVLQPQVRRHRLAHQPRVVAAAVSLTYVCFVAFGFACRRQSPFYAQLGEALAADKINVNLFLAADSYVDVATLGMSAIGIERRASRSLIRAMTVTTFAGDLCKQTSGECYYYPGFNAAHDRQKLHQELAHNLLRTAAYDSVMRIRTSTGTVIHSGALIVSVGRTPRTCTSADDCEYDDRPERRITPWQLHSTAGYRCRGCWI